MPAAYLSMATTVRTFRPLQLLAVDNPSLGKIVVPLAIVIVLAGALLAILSLVRRRVRTTDFSSAPRGFTLGALRDLHREGKLTNEEFERAKQMLVQSVQASLKKDAKVTENAEPLNTDLK